MEKSSELENISVKQAKESFETNAPHHWDVLYTIKIKKLSMWSPKFREDSFFNSQK